MSQKKFINYYNTMKKDRDIKLIVIGGSAGSIPVVNQILSSLPKEFKTPIVICLHRMKNVAEGMKEVLETNYYGTLIEPNDKEPIREGCAYIAPSNYHLLVCKKELSFCLSTEDLFNYSRPSIDLTFCSISETFKKNMLGIIITGANKDGAHGMSCIHKKGGLTIAQNPKECTAPYMPKSAIELNCINHILTISEIIDFILKNCK